jgi:hypothetical protein
MRVYFQSDAGNSDLTFEVDSNKHALFIRAAEMLLERLEREMRDDPTWADHLGEPEEPASWGLFKHKRAR